ncbi:hypothetical protein HBH70_067990 [Parastagonospora nodorum]|nr:hypothetical protein HBH49_088870 [Parastagonospora nodorum]KAH4119819.1 hypothetical protein HBH47_125310 [Parastagonospora nodorum]KAH4195630.1 hypothetical protein HBH42_074780 [Parastagonospora nodorum]KAH4220916.1 hypothetical protein HBI06_170050 [Parastagonospora nodorum]KAH4237520.1 hypothetical protein HBI05_132490 [Parastagonospora nodorum]
MTEANHVIMDGVSVPARAGVLQFNITEGDKTKTYYIAQALLKTHAPRFLKSPPCEEGLKRPERIIDIDDIDIETFDFLVKWLIITDKDVAKTVSKHALHVDYVAEAWHKIMPMLNTYIFGYKYKIWALQVASLTQLALYMQAYIDHREPHDSSKCRSTGNQFPREQIAFIYDENKRSNSIALRQLLVDNFCAADMEGRLPCDELLRYPSVFLVEVTHRRLELAASKGTGAETEGILQIHLYRAELMGLKRKRAD